MTVGQLIKKLEKFDSNLEVTRFPQHHELGIYLRRVECATRTNQKTEGTHETPTSYIESIILE